MIKIIKNTKEQVIFQKENREEAWFNHDCSNENLLKMCNREGDAISRVQFDDGEYIGSLLYVYFKTEIENNIDTSTKEPITAEINKISWDYIKNNPDNTPREAFIDGLKFYDKQTKVLQDDLESYKKLADYERNCAYKASIDNTKLISKNTQLQCELDQVKEQLESVTNLLTEAMSKIGQEQEQNKKLSQALLQVVSDDPTFMEIPLVQEALSNNQTTN